MGDFTFTMLKVAIGVLKTFIASHKYYYILNLRNQHKNSAGRVDVNKPVMFKELTHCALYILYISSNVVGNL